MSILNVNTIQPIGSGTTVTVTATELKASNFITVGTGASVTSPSANVLTLGTNSAERLRITSAGLIGIGTVSPSGPIHAHVASGTQRSYLEASAAHSFLRLKSGSTSYNSGVEFFSGASNIANVNGLGAGGLQFEVNGDERLRIDSSGNLGLGANNPDTLLHVRSSDNVLAKFESTDADALIEFKDNSTTDTILMGALGGDDLLLRCDAGNIILKTSNNTEKLRITSGGNVNIGGDYTQTSRKVMISGGSNVGQLEVKGTEADIWMNSTGPSGGSVWRILGAQGNNTHRWRVYDSTNSRDCINVYNDGSVVTPVQPRFWARRSTDQSSYDGRNVGGTWIKYDVEEYDIGGNFATSGADQGRFIAPVSGLYLFHAAAYKTTSTGDWTQAWFDVDGSRKSGTDWVFDGSRFAQNSIQIYLTAGQKIGFHPYNNVSGNTILDSVNHTWFKGCLLG